MLESIEDLSVELPRGSLGFVPENSFIMQSALFLWGKKEYRMEVVE